MEVYENVLSPNENENKAEHSQQFFSTFLS